MLLGVENCLSLGFVTMNTLRRWMDGVGEMLVVGTIARIRRDHLVKGVAIKKLAWHLKDSKNTIRKVLRGDATARRYERKIRPMPKLGPC